MTNNNEFKNLDENFIEDLFKALPVNVFFKNTKGEYEFCSQYWQNINVDKQDPNWSIKGKTDADIRKDKENIEAARKSDELIIKTGKPQKYVIKVTNDDQTISYMELTKNPVFNNGKVVGIVGLIQNVTERVILEQEIQEKQKIDEMTGVYNRNYYEHFIKNEAENIINPYTIVVVDLNSLKYVNDTYGHNAGDDYIEKTANILKTFLPKQAKIFRTGGDEFICVIEHSNTTKLDDNIRTIRLACSSIYLYKFQMSLAIGYTSTYEIPNDIKDLIKEADEAMYSDKENYYNKIKTIQRRTI